MRTVLIFFIFYFLVLIQASFLPHLGVLGGIFSPVFILAILANFLPPRAGLASAFAGGFFIDVFSAGLIGRNVLILLGLAILIKIILRKYVRSPLR